MLRALSVAVCLLASASSFAGPIEDAEEEMRKAKVALDRHDYEEAVGHYLVARSLAPESSGPYLGLGLAYAAMSRCQEAVPVLQEYLRRKTRDPNPAAQSTLSACRAALESRAHTVAPPPPPPVSTVGYLLVTSEPVGAEVRVDDEEGDTAPRGRTPLTLTLGAGRHVITLVHAGYRDASQTVTVAAGQLGRVEAILVPTAPVYAAPQQGRLAVHVAPIEGNITVNGVPAPAPTRSYELALPPGIYHVSVERSGYETVEQDLIVRPGQTVSDDVKLVSTAPRERKRKAGIAVGVILAAGAVGGAIAIGVIFGTPPPETHFGQVTLR